jgi:hypothetical protein
MSASGFSLRCCCSLCCQSVRCSSAQTKRLLKSFLNLDPQIDQKCLRSLGSGSNGDPGTGYCVGFCPKSLQYRLRMAEEPNVEKGVPTPNSKDPDDYLELWKATRGVVERMEIEFDKALLVLHPAAITGSAALYAQFSKASPGQRCMKYVLFVAWAFGYSASYVPSPRFGRALRRTMKV